MTAIAAVLFDLGHTLVDLDIEDGALLTSYREVHEFLDRLGLGQPPAAPDLMLRVSRQTLDVVIASYDRGEIEELDMLTIFDQALRQHGYHLDAEIVRDLLRREHAAYASHLLVPPESIAVLEEIRSRGLRIGLVSNATIPGPLMRDDLDLMGLSGIVDAAVFSSEVGVRKPDERIFRPVLDQLGVDPRACVFVGDRLKEDVRGSRSLGMRPVLTHEFRQEILASGDPVPVIRCLPELLRVLDDVA